MENEKKQDQKPANNKPESEMGKDATSERVAEEESGGALPSEHSDED